MLLIWRRCLHVQVEKPQTVSNVKWKLQQYQDMGLFERQSVKESKRRNEHAKKASLRSSFRDGLSPQKTLILLRSRYDGAIIQDDKGQAIDLNAFSPNNLRINDPRSLLLFKGLMQIKKIQRKRVDDRIIMTLAGVTRSSLCDSYFVARDILYLLEQDNDIVRAMEVCRLARRNASVGINAIVEWCLRRSKIDLARKVLVDRGKWGIPPSPATYVIYFSGLSDCHQWGGVNDGLANHVIELFKDNKVPRNIETFNAALKLLLKNYSNDQVLAWTLLEMLGAIQLRPDAQTFTIFLQGLRMLYKQEVEQIQRDSTILHKDRTKQLFEKQAILVQRADMVMEKAMSFSTPPTPPSEDEVSRSPNLNLLSEYKKQLRQPMLNIDRHLGVAFLSCYCDASAGTSWSNKSGSHYWYLQQSLAYLQAWLPEVRELVRFISCGPLEGGGGSVIGNRGMEEVVIVQPSDDIKRKTDKRLQTAGIPDDISPKSVSRAKAMSELNPSTIFPRSAISLSHDKNFSKGVEKKLIDFARVKDRESPGKKRSQGKVSRGSKQKQASLNRKKPGINKFFLRLFLDCLLRLGLHDEFLKAMWLSISNWGGIKLDTTKLHEWKPSLMTGLSGDLYPDVTSLSNKEDNRFSCSSEAQLDVIDIGIVEDFIHKIEEHIPRSSNPTALAVEVLAAFSNRRINREKDLYPRPSTFNAVFAMLNRDIYRYNERNATLGYQKNKRRNLANNTSKSSMTFSQLEQLLNSLDVLVRCIFARFGGKSMDSSFLQSYNNLIQRIYSNTWDGAPESHPNAIAVHTKLIRSGILMYKPNFLIDKRQDDAYSRLIVESMTFVHDKLRGRTDLSKNEVDLMMSLRKLFHLENSKDVSEEKYEELQMNIYRLSGKIIVEIGKEAKLGSEFQSISDVELEKGQEAELEVAT